MHAAGDLRISKGVALDALVGKLLPLLFQTLLHVVVQLDEKCQETIRNHQPHKGVESLISRLRTHLASSGSAWDPDACISSTSLSHSKCMLCRFCLLGANGGTNGNHMSVSESFISSISLINNVFFRALHFFLIFLVKFYWYLLTLMHQVHPIPSDFLALNATTSGEL